VIFEKTTRNSRASAILAEPSCAVKDKKHAVYEADGTHPQHNKPSLIHFFKNE
jgi:hypothetical protein